MEQLGDAVDVDVIDLTGHYSGTVVDSGADPLLYATVAEEFPDAWLEDPRVDDRTRIALAGAEDRVTWDAPIHSVDDIAEMPIAPRTINIKPSRIGSLERLMAVYDYVPPRCAQRHIAGRLPQAATRRCAVQPAARRTCGHGLSLGVLVRRRVRPGRPR